MESEPPTILIIDDDKLVRDALDSLFRSTGLKTILFESAQALLDASFPDCVCCIVTDVRMPQMSGLEFQNVLIERGDRMPLIFMTGHGDIPMSVQAMKAGAVDFLAKPFRDQDMLDAVNSALAKHRQQRRASENLISIKARRASLTPREREVMDLVVTGMMNKQVAGELGLSEITIKLHRANLMKKMAVRTLAELVRVAEAIERES
ncbi:DNA-binding response regulator [Sphingomonas oleivorans]|uniref:DNA-binding response regulator n=1 Tax=Sphingomonas oleivorans TaxID=1735121 RepID=A0A2T5FWV8_9SPHN|nr:DNA-binding response regulator [Sphingomonas oleivorans]